MEINSNKTNPQTGTYKPEKGISFYNPQIKDSFLSMENQEFIKQKYPTTIQVTKHELSVFDVAAYVVKKLGELTTMKLHKLLYYAQAWSLVWDEKPLFKEDIEAWSNGPVIRELFNYHRGYFTISSITIGNSDLLSQSQKETIDSVIGFYGEKTSQWLIELTHLEDPWKMARRGLKDSERGNKTITLESMAQYYSSL